MSPSDEYANGGRKKKKEKGDVGKKSQRCPGETPQLHQSDAAVVLYALGVQGRETWQEVTSQVISESSTGL